MAQERCASRRRRWRWYQHAFFALLAALAVVLAWRSPLVGWTGLLPTVLGLAALWQHKRAGYWSLVAAAFVELLLAVALFAFWPVRAYEAVLLNVGRWVVLAILAVVIHREWPAMDRAYIRSWRSARTRRGRVAGAISWFFLRSLLLLAPAVPLATVFFLAYRVGGPEASAGPGLLFLGVTGLTGLATLVLAVRTARALADERMSNT